jgi:predicted ATPase/DNA-binding SARP family transcriptional activator
VATDASLPPLAVGVLGPLRVAVDGVPADIPGAKRRAVLALLALAEGHAVSVDEIVDALWPAEPPEKARAALHSHIFRLRRHLGPLASRLEALEGGYRLRLEEGELDLHQARALLARAQALLPTDAVAASERLQEARRLWRGRPLGELGEVLPVAARALGLEELRRQINDLLVECSLAAGDAASVVGVAAEAVAEDPLRESTVLLLVQALAATGRGAEALRAAYDYRRRLRDEAGLDPSPRLADLERAVASGAATPSRTPLPPQVPAPPTPLVGRESELAALARLLASDRIVTVVGAGGVGKTQLALEVARRYDDARFLGLAPVTDGDAIPYALASALHLDAARGDVLSACVALLRAGPQLLVVDNCEHVVRAARDVVAALVQSCPGLTVLATSREPLGLPAECQLRLEPLALPDPLSATSEHAPAVAVFLDRARRARPGFAPGPDDMALVADILRRLDGLPLAIELAASRLSSFGLADLHSRLDRSLDLLGTGRAAADARHETLRATLQWSYDLLPATEQRLFRHLAVYPDGVDVATAELVAHELALEGDPAAAISHLVDASMLNAQLDGAPRYRMLETLRTFGLDRLRAAGEGEEADVLLLQWAVAAARWTDAKVTSEDEPSANARLRRELPNLRAAWRLARRRGDLDTAIELIVSLYEATTWRDIAEVWDWAEELSADPAVHTHPRAAAALAAASECAWMQGAVERAARLAHDAVRAASDQDGRWRALSARATVALARGEYGDAVRYGLEASELSPRGTHPRLLAALAAAYQGDVDRASSIADAVTPASPTMRAEQAYVAGECANVAGRHAAAEHHYQHAIEMARSVDATFVMGIASLGLVTDRKSVV